MKTETKYRELICWTWLEVMQYIESQSTNYDLNASAGFPNYGFIKKDGSQYHTLSFSDFLGKCNTQLGTNINPDLSYYTGGITYLKVCDVEKPEEVLTKVETLTVLDEVPVFGRELESTEEEVLPSSEVLTVNWVYLDEVTSEKDKLALDVYAEKFGINLKRNKSYVNMLKTFKQQLEEKGIK